ncbi:sugar phosphate isomerase/epimerase family protein [Mycobacterium bourgelatii]|uniref:Xylose isomerase-like TIM barrel domain-containing protein n=1 Tax=Mycobacterium bourgelatii TaxID=1273442 RepID=A0A7I9YPK5_MYCBU|nr:TIM barrel protein [Mycobacterium bourgelatii]MCV6973777.1 sugar phosphate isomerase/epimerase [Mycobacterium bourgelatii]GFG90611.1 hypothetical protein MBOU_26530 [Mycobacterium bourgelatii]
MDRLAIGCLSVFGLPPVDLVNVAADLGCRHISTTVRGFPLVPLGYRPFTLRDTALRMELRAVLNHRGVSISLGDGFLVLPDADTADYGGDLDVLAELGTPRINVVSLDPDLGRTFDQLATLAELAAERGIVTNLEPVPGLTVGDLPTALAAVKHVARQDFVLLIDTMHLVRSGARAAEVAALEPGYIGYAQINDTTLRPRGDNYMDEAMFERMVPGEGDLPLRDILSALPRDIIIEIEVPQRSLAMDGVGPIDRLRPCVAAARRLLAGALAR